MYLAPNFQGNQPITWWGRVPVYLTTILTAILAGGIVLMAVAGAMQVNHQVPFAISCAKACAPR